MVTIIDEYAKKLDGKFKGSEFRFEMPESVFSPTPITAENAKLFVERDQQIDELVNAEFECINGMYRGVIIHGISGSGKTSLVNVMLYATGRSENAKLIISRYGASDYLKGPEALYRQILFAICDRIAQESRETRDSGEEESEFRISVQEKAREISGNLVFTEFISPGTKRSLNEILKDIGSHLIELPADMQLTPTNVIKALLEQRLTQYSLVLILDDYHRLLTEKNKAFLQGFFDVIAIPKCFYLLILYTRDFQRLKETGDLILKNTFSIGVPKLTVTGCKELLRRRLLFSRDNEKQIDKDPNYPQELIPFSESAVEAIANTVDCIPLSFINLLKRAKIEAENMNESGINDKVTFRLLHSNVDETYLTDVQKKVLEHIRLKKQVIIGDIAALVGASPAYAYHILDSLRELRLLEKQRKGRFMVYRLKPVEV